MLLAGISFFCYGLIRDDMADRVDRRVIRHSHSMSLLFVRKVGCKENKVK